MLFMTSCLKRNETNVNATCLDSCMTFNVKVATGLNSATLLSNWPVELGWSRPGTPLGDPGRLIASGKTSTTGLVNFSFKAKPKELESGQFYVRVREKKDYFSGERSFYGITKFDSTINVHLHVPSKATLKIRFKNFNPTSPDDFFECLPMISTFGSTGVGISMKKADGQPGNPWFYGDQAPFSLVELTGTTAGNQFTHFSILKKKNGIRINQTDSLFIEKGQTKTYDIEF